MAMTKRNIWNGNRLNDPYYQALVVETFLDDIWEEYGRQFAPTVIFALLAEHMKGVQK